MHDELNIKIKTSIDKTLENLITDDEIREEDVKYIGDLIDIKKDISNMEYWDIKEEMMNMRYSYGGRDSYGNYGNSYGARRRDSRGRYMEGGRRYRGHDMIDDMSDSYGRYSEGKEAYGRGNYGAKEDSMKSLEYMLQSVEDFLCMLEEDADSQEEIDMIKKTARRISEM